MKLIFCVALTLCMTVCVKGYFNCLNPGMPCQNSGVCSADGTTCTCVGSFAGYACQYPDGNNGLNDCVGADCNGQTCDDVGAGDGAFVCQCTADQMGVDCAGNRYAVTCTETQLDVTIVPTFTPDSVFLTNIPLCVTTGSGPFTHTYVYAGAGNCPAITEQSDTPAAGQKTWEVNYVVKQAATYITSADFVVNVKCVSGAGQTAMGSISTSSYVPSNLGSASTTDNIGDVAVAALPSSATQAVGTEIVFTLTGSNGVAKLKFVSIDVTTASAANTVSIFAAGCPVTGNTVFFGSQMPATTAGTLTEAKAWLNVIKFDGEADVIWTFGLTACVVAGDAACADATCSARKKRAVGESNYDNNTRSFNYQIRVIDIYSENYQNQLSGKDEPCETTNKMTAAVVAMAVACFVLLVICLVFIVRVLSRRSSDVNKSCDHMSFQNPQMMTK